MSIYKGTELIAGNVNQSTVSTFKLFHHDWFDYSFSDLSWVCADDFEWIEGDKYPIAYEHLYADYISTSTYTQETIGSYTIQFKIAPDGHRIVDHANEGIVQNIYGESGVAWYYILDTVNERFKLPRTKHGLSGLRDNVGEYIAPGAPNITGTTNGGSYGSMRSGNPSTPSVSGCFTGTISRGLAGENTNYGMHVNFDASKSNSIYGASDTIQPPSTQQYLYFYLGQFPVSALVNPDIAATKANTNGDNFNSTGRNIANWSSNVTNCITQIPQDIKLELNNGVLTLKAGSKVYVPNGFESDGTTPHFEIIIMQSDLQNQTISTANTSFIRYNYTTGNLFCDWPTSSFSSGTSVPSGYNGWFYNTTINTIRHYANGAIDTPEQCSLPLGIVTNTSSSVASIDQVFNGFGYIGLTTFVLPGVKALAPNGRNLDGTLKNHILSFSTLTLHTLLTDEWSLFGFLQSEGIIGWGVPHYFESEEKPVLASGLQYARWFDIKNNYTYWTNDGGITWNKNYAVFLGRLLKEADPTITQFNTKTSYRALDYNDSNIISSWALPSNRYINLTLGATAATYLAPANGYMLADMYGQVANEYVYIFNTTTALGMQSVRGNGGRMIGFVPCKRGDVIQVDYSGTASVCRFRFVYAEGEV